MGAFYGSKIRNGEINQKSGRAWNWGMCLRFGGAKQKHGWKINSTEAGGSFLPAKKAEER